MSGGVPEAVAAFIAREALLSPGERVLVGVSGGADSVALLLVLHELGYACGVAHLDHGTRGGGSAEDATFVGALALRLGCPFFVYREAIRASDGRSFEMAAREARYGFFLRTAREQGYDALATGHHADDQAETVLLRLMRGTGPVGLGGIAPCRVQEGVRIVRPLLEQSRGDLVAWLRVRGEAWCEDHTNADTALLRNRVRHDLLPYLAAQFNPAVREALVRTARLMRRYDAMLPRGGSDTIVTHEDGDVALDRVGFAGLAEAEQGEVVQDLARLFGVVMDEAHTLRVSSFISTGETGAAFDLGAGVCLYQGRDKTLVLEPAPEEAPPAAAELPCPGSLRWGDYLLVARAVRLPLPVPPEAYCGASRQIFDADALPGGIQVRAWMPGDRMRPFGLDGTRKLQDVFTDAGIPAPKRGTMPVVVSGETILWVPRCRRAEHAPVSAETAQAIEIEVRHASE